MNGEIRSLLYRLVADELARRPEQLVLELPGATAADDAGIDALIGASALAAESDTSFCLVAQPDGPVVQALAAAGLLERFELFTTLGEAQRQR
ncbi:MAG: STAS domain-containing protein [Mycobacterium sp.]